MTSDLVTYSALAAGLVLIGTVLLLMVRASRRRREQLNVARRRHERALAALSETMGTELRVPESHGYPAVPGGDWASSRGVVDGVAVEVGVAHEDAEAPNALVTAAALEPPSGRGFPLCSGWRGNDVFKLPGGRPDLASAAPDLPGGTLEELVALCERIEVTAERIVLTARPSEPRSPAAARLLLDPEALARLLRAGAALARALARRPDRGGPEHG